MNRASVNHRLKGRNNISAHGGKFPVIAWLGVLGFLLGGVLQPCALAQIETRTFNASADAFNYHLNPTANNGGNTVLETGGLNGNRNTRTLVRFNPSFVLDTNILIVSATLRLTTVRIDNFTTIGNQDVPNKEFILSAYRILTTNWVEGTGYFATQSGTVTWNSLRHGTELWDVAGPGPASTNVADSATATFVYTNTAWRVTINSNFSWNVATDVSAWNSDRSTALPSWLIISSSEATGTTNNGVLFASREHPTIALRPLLTVEFIALPEPGAGTLLLLSGLALLAIRRRS